MAGPTSLTNPTSSTRRTRDFAEHREDVRIDVAATGSVDQDETTQGTPSSRLAARDQKSRVTAGP